MINIERPAQSPTSLETQAVKDYLDDVIAWKNDSTLSKPDKMPDYRNSDLIEAFDNCFFAKCYLTEKKFESSYEMDVEHFLPKKFEAFPELRYEWTNLYPCDHDANMAKQRILPVGGYLDPCNPNDDVENDLLQWLDFRGRTCHFEATNNANIKAVNTAQLLDRIHNGHDTVSRIKTGGLRKALIDKRDEVNQVIMSWLSAKTNGDRQEEFKHAQHLKRLLSRKASFTMLMRSTSAVRMYVPKDFLD